MGNQQWDIPAYVVKGVATSGHFYDLSPLQFGIFDRQTSSVATVTGNGKEFFLAVGSPHTRDSLTKFYSGMKDPQKSSYFLLKDIKGFEKSFPSKPRNEEWVIGYGGGKNDPTLHFEKGKSYQLKIRLYGEAAFTRFNRSVEKIITLDTLDCPTLPCEGCTDTVLDPKATITKIAEQINNNVEFKEFKLKAQVVSSDYTASTPNAFHYSLTVVDNGDADALLAVQRNYVNSTGAQIDRLSYSSGTSVYEINGVTSAPATFTPSTAVLLALCGTCPSGYTLQAARDVYVVTRQLNTTTDLDDTASQATFAAAVVTAYSGISGTGVYLGIANGAAKVQFEIAAGTTVAIASGTADLVEKQRSIQAECIPSSASPISWVRDGSGYTKTRTLTATLPLTDCNATYSTTVIDAELQAFPSYVAGSATDITDSVGGGLLQDNCVQVIQITQISQFMTDDCMSADVAVYADQFISFRSVIFKPPVVVITPDTTVKVGLRLSAPFFSTSFGDCSYDPYEFYDSEPLRMELSVYDQEGNPCTFGDLAQPRMVQGPRYRRLSGYFVRQKYIEGGVYFTYRTWAQDPRLREVIDNTATSIVDKNKFYVAYYLKFTESREQDNFAEKGQVWEPVIFVEEGDLTTQKALETAIQSVTAKNDVKLKVRGELPS